MQTFFKYFCECETEAAKYAYSYLKVILKRCLSMYFLVPSAHLAFITAPMTQTWLCSIPAPHQDSVGEQSNDYCCRSPRTTGNMAAGSLCSKLEIASCGPDTFLYFSEEKKKQKGSQWPDIYTIMRLCLQKHWFMFFASHDKYLINWLMTSHWYQSEFFLHYCL